MPHKMTCFLIKVSGLVQGVFFRHSAKIEAEKLGLKGCAKNLKDGSVEIIVCLTSGDLPQGDGSKDKINEFVEWRRNGSSMAKVERIEIGRATSELQSQSNLL